MSVLVHIMSMNSVQDLYFSFPSLLAGTYNCAGCCYTWAQSFGLVQLQQNSNELKPQESFMCLHWKRQQPITNSCLLARCRWYQKSNLSRDFRLKTHTKFGCIGPQRKQLSEIAGKVIVPISHNHTKKRLFLSTNSLFFIWFLQN